MRTQRGIHCAEGESENTDQQINRQSGEAVEDPPQVEQKAERDRQKPSVNSSDKKTACMPDNGNGINGAEAVEPVKVYMEWETAEIEKRR